MHVFPVLLTFLTAHASVQSQHTVVLSNGTVVQREGKHPYLYWNCEDTYLSKADKAANFGAEPILVADRDNRPLIRFEDLHRAVGPGKRIIGAKLILTLAGANPPSQIQVARVLADWREGAGSTRLKTGTQSPWSATWDFRHSPAQLSGLRWTTGGCTKSGEDKAVEPTAKFGAPAKDTGRYEIAGLAADVQRWYDQYYTNFGWVLEVEGENVQFHSSQSAYGRPALEITYADAPPAAGTADLDVTYIERLPEYNRYDPTGNAYAYKEERGTQVGVMTEPGLARDPKWPRDGDLVNYRAHVLNNGPQAAPKFHYRWYINGRMVREGDGGPVNAGAEVVLEAPAIWADDHTDHRTRTMALEVVPVEGETIKNNNYLSIYTQALNLGIHVERSVYDYFRQKPNALGGNSFEDWVQWQFWLWNEVWLDRSRFSFAPDGCLERVRIQRIEIHPDGTLDPGGNHVPGGKTNFLYDGEWGFNWPADRPDEIKRYIDDARDQSENGLIHECSHQIGLIDLYVMNIDSSMPDGTRGKVRLKAGGSVVTRGCIDPYGGLMGGGDTRNDTMVPTFLPIHNLPNADPLQQFPLFEPTGLYSGSSVAGLNATLGYRRGYYGEYLYRLPKLIHVRPLDVAGRPMPGARITFFQENGGEFKDEPPVFEGATNEDGTFRLPNRPTQEGDEFQTRTGLTLRPNPFGRLDVVGSNGTFLVRCRHNGQEDWQFLKVWQLNMAYERGNRTAVIFDLPFQISPAPLGQANVAAGKSVSVSAADGAAVSNLTDGDRKTVLPVPAEEEAWLTIDLGAEVPIGEIALHAYGRHGDFWRQFEILAYKDAEPGAFAPRVVREADWRWTVQHRRDVDPVDPEYWTVTYRTIPITARYIRIVNKGEGGGQIAEVTVRAAETSQPPQGPQPPAER